MLMVMGMDIYLEDPTVEAKREGCQKALHRALRLRDRAKDDEERARYQKKADEWYEKMYSGKMGYFRVSYNDYSISYWLMCNIDPKAKGEWGIEPFYSAVKNKEEPRITDVAFHRNLLKTARRWYEKACTLKGKKSVLMVTDYEKSDFEKDKWVKKKVVLEPKRTDEYIEWLKELVDFAELAVKTGKPIYVSA
jgi:hypothetical protein